MYSTVNLLLPDSVIFVTTSMYPGLLVIGTSATMLPSLSFTTIVPSLNGSPVLASVAFTRTVTSPAVLLTNDALTFVSRFVSVRDCFVMFPAYVMLPGYSTYIVLVSFVVVTFTVAIPFSSVNAVPMRFVLSSSEYTFTVPLIIAVPLVSVTVT